LGLIASVVATSSVVQGQTTPDLFTKVEMLTLTDGTPVSGPAAISGNTAVVGHDGVVSVFRRPPGGDHWVERATLVASEGTSGFGRSVAVDGTTIVVGADGAAFVFARLPGLGWQEVKQLEGDTNAASFGFSVDVSGTTVVVAAPVPDVRPAAGPGVVHLFERDNGGPNAWGEADRLSGEPLSNPTFNDVFGASVSIDGERVIVGASWPKPPPGSLSPIAYIFSRGSNGADTWSQDAKLVLPGGGFDANLVVVSISGNTAAAGVNTAVGGGGLRIFQADRIQPNVWVEIGRKGGEIRWVDIDGDFLIEGLSGFSAPPLSSTVHTLARNQGSGNAWGEVASVPAFLNTQAVAIGGDTALVTTASATGRTIDVYVADTDRDGLRDGLDPCPRDPLNNFAESCQRASAIHPVLDELINQGEVTSETRGRRQIITATFTNTSETAVQNPFFEVTELTGDNVLLNGDAGRGRVGATVSPDVGDGILSPGESMTVTFRIRLRTHDPFQFFVTFHGDPVP
jgi:hypothetical protein